MHSGRALGRCPAIGTVDLTPHRVDQETAQEGVEERDNGEGEPRDVVMRLALEPRKPVAGIHLNEHRSASDEDAESREEQP